MEFVQIVTEYGITLATVVGLGFAVIKLYNDNKALRDKNDMRIEGMMTQISDLTDSVNNNTLTITKLIDKIDSKVMNDE